MSEIKKVKPSLPSGTRDFLPQEVAKRNYIFSVIKSVFEKYGFQQIETPVLENLSTLTGKYGEEGDQLLFKVLNSGDFLKDANPETLQNKDSKKLIPQIADRGLRYDLTVPLARYVVQHQGDLVFPFKRYHLAPVWRADRPQKGRYREFYQCDADVIGSNSLLNEVELTQIYLDVFQKLNIKIKVSFSSRKFLQGLADYCGAKNDFVKFATILDKYLDTDKLVDQLNQIGDGSAGIKYKTLTDKVGTLESIENILTYFKTCFEYVYSNDGIEGVAEIEAIFKHINPNENNLEFLVPLARGLNYYTGIIWEVVLDKNVEANQGIVIGSLGGGGRYGNLTEMFGGINMSGVGISFGIERIYDVMEELNLFPTTITQGVKVLLVPREESLEDFTFSQVQKLREQGISAEIFLGNVKKQKQFTYAEQKHIAYLIEVGENEQQSGLFRLRNAVTREMENDLSIEKIIEKLK
jgi:histidyl-tRNA synthetase